MIMSTNEILMLILMLAFLLVVGPWHGLREKAAMKAASPQRLPGLRRSSYNWTIGLEWGVSLALVAWWILSGRGANEIGLHFAVSGWQWLAVVLSLAVAAVFAAYSWRLAGQPTDLAQVREQLGDLKLLSPHDRSELRHFAWVAVTAGICEEILYRGLLMTLLAGPLGLWPAVVVSSVVFGLGHAYQGWMGMVRTGFTGFIMALMVVFTGNLVVAMIVHAAIDLVQGRLLWSAVNAPVPEDQDGPEGTVHPQPAT
jgi:membrane protease YdiL (CAAX protease family)